MTGRISPIPSEEGRTYFESCLVIVNYSYDYLIRLGQNPFWELDSDEQIANIALCHENIHFLQFISSSFFFDKAQILYKKLNLLKRNIANKTRIDDIVSDISEIKSSIYNTQSDISITSIVEGVAVIESFKICHANFTHYDFEAFLHKFFYNDVSSEKYTLTYRLLSEKIGKQLAFNLLSPISSICLNYSEPEQVFKWILTAITPDIAERLCDLSIFQVYDLLGLDIRKDHPIFGKFSTSLEEPNLLSAVLLATKKVVPGRIIFEMAAMPSIEIRDEYKRFSMLLKAPLIITATNTDSVPKSPRTGLCTIDKFRSVFVPLVLDYTALFGVVSVIENFLNDKKIYQFCPHEKCPTYPTNLCARYYAPPSSNLGYENCRFPRTFEEHFSVKPMDFSLDALRNSFLK